ncbi:MAG TPA: hypothetical protein VI612_01615 [Candidatus Nanoarchaeia archaeon]|nr:hypothetical protein [Candidatus Nanoarchaeia archaeon]
MAQYTYTQYCRDGRIATVDSENLSTYGKIEALRQYGHRNLNGGIPGAPAKKTPLVTIENLLEDPAAIASALMKRNPGKPVTDADIAEVQRTLISRVRQAFDKTYEAANRRLRQYGAQFGHPVPKPAPKPSPTPANLERRTQQYLCDVTQTETSHLRPDGKRKR